MQRQRRNIIEQVTAYIHAQLPRRRATLVGAAKEMAMSARTLQRNLDRASLSFTQILTSVRIELATDAIAQGASTKQLTELLAFSESSAVSRFLHANGLALRPSPRAGVAELAPSYERI